MYFSKKLLSLMLFCLYSLLAIIEYVPYHVYLLTDSMWANGIYLFLSGVIDFLLPALLATVMLVRKCDKGLRRVILECLTVSLSRVFFYAPYFYMEFFTMGLDTWEAIPLALLVGLLISVGFGVFCLLLFCLGLLVHRYKAKKAKKQLPASESLRAMLAEGGSFDFSRRGVGILFSISLACFIARLPIVDTVSYLVDYGDSIRMEEILSIILEVILVLAMMVVTQLVTTRFAAALLRDEN